MSDSNRGDERSQWWDPALTETRQKGGPDRDPRQNPKAVSHRGGRPGRGWRATAGGCDERARLSPQIAWDPPHKGFTWTLEVTFSEVQDRKGGISGDKEAPSPGPEREIYLGRSYSDALGESMKTQCPRAGRNCGCRGKGPREAWGARMTVSGGDDGGYGGRS